MGNTGQILWAVLLIAVLAPTPMTADSARSAVDVKLVIEDRSKFESKELTAIVNVRKNVCQDKVNGDAACRKACPENEGYCKCLFTFCLFSKRECLCQYVNEKESMKKAWTNWMVLEDFSGEHDNDRPCKDKKSVDADKKCSAKCPPNWKGICYYTTFDFWHTKDQCYCYYYKPPFSYKDMMYTWLPPASAHKAQLDDRVHELIPPMASPLSSKLKKTVTGLIQKASKKKADLRQKAASKAGEPDEHHRLTYIGKGIQEPCYVREEQGLDEVDKKCKTTCKTHGRNDGACLTKKGTAVEGKPRDTCFCMYVNYNNCDDTDV